MIIGGKEPSTSFAVRFLTVLPMNAVITEAIRVESVPKIISKGPLPKILEMKQPIVSPIAVSGKINGSIVNASAILNCTAP